MTAGAYRAQTPRTLTTSARRQRWSTIGRWFAVTAGRVAQRSWRAGSWVFRRPSRMLVAAWLTGFFLIGQAVPAAAVAPGGDGLIAGPDLGSAGGSTVFERFGPERFALYLQLSDSHHGAPYVQEAMWNLLRSVESALLYLVAALARGAITSMQWLLNLTLYTDHAATIDTAVRGVAAQVFWPLFTATMGIGAFAAYTRMKKEGGGSLFHDAAWLVAASIFAGAFATHPSAVLTTLDDARTALAAGAMKGYAGYGPAGSSAAGFPGITVPDDQAGASRKLADAMWNVYVVTPWCYVNFNSMTACADLGDDYLTGSPRWAGLVEWMAGNNGGNSDDTTGAPFCPPELNANCDWVRGQSFGRLGATIFVVAVTVPLVGMLLVLILFGVMAVVGFLLLILIGVFFVLGWMIPGRPRQMGVRWFEELLGSLIQSVVITAILGSVMVLDAVLNAGIPRYGFFMVGLLNLATFVVGFRMRGRLENITGLGAGGSASPFSGYMAMRALGAVGRAANRATRGAIGGAAAATPVLARATAGLARMGGMTAAAGARGIGGAGRLLRSLPNNLLNTTTGGGARGIATPYRHGPGTSGSGRKTITPTPRTGVDNPGELPAGGSTERGRTRALEPPGTGRQTQGDRRVFVAPDPAPTPRRTFAPTTHRGQPGRQATETPGIFGTGPHRPVTNLVKPVPGARSWRESPRTTAPARAAGLFTPPTRATGGGDTAGRGRPVMYPTSRTGTRELPHRITPPSTGSGGPR